MKRALAIVLCAALYSCGGINPPLDCRTLGCDPGFECKEIDGVWRCVEAPSTDLLLRRDGTVFVRHSDGLPFDWKGCEHCCYDVGNWTHSMGWPVINRRLVDFASDNGCTVLHARIGPFIAGEHGEPAWEYGPYVQGGGGRADLTKFDSRWWGPLDGTVEYAEEKGLVVVLDLIDGWSCRHAKQYGRPHPWRSNWNQQGIDAVSSCGRELNPTQRAFLEHAVDVLADNMNIVYEDGNEIGLVRNAAGDLEVDPLYDPSWTAELRQVVLEREQANGYPVHLFGTNAGQSAWNVQGVAVIFEHNPGVAAAPRAGKPTVVNEYNPQPPMTAKAVFAQVCRARELGSYFDLWRDGMGDEEYLEALRLIREGDCEAAPPPPDCTLGTPTMKQAKAQGMRPECVVSNYGQGRDATCRANFGREYCAKAGWTDGRTKCPPAPAGHPQELACNRQFLGSQCPQWRGVCTGTPDQCPIGYDIQRGGVEHIINRDAGCPTAADQGGNHQTIMEGYWVKPSGKGWMEVGDHDFSVYTRHPEQIDE